MPQYDAGPGDWSDRDWEAPDHKPPTQAKRRLTLPPWVLVTAAAVIAILSCIGLVLVVNHARQKGEATATVEVKAATQAVAFATAVLTPTATTEITPTATAVLPISVTVTASPAVFTEIAPGAQVVVGGTLGQGLNLRATPTTGGRLVGSAKDGAVLTVLEGPQEANGYTWWKVQTPDGKVGWAAGKFLTLKGQ
jgi:hypothetical protein